MKRKAHSTAYGLLRATAAALDEIGAGQHSEAWRQYRARHQAREIRKVLQQWEGGR